MVQAGYVRHVGRSEAGADTVRRAHAVHTRSLTSRSSTRCSRGGSKPRSCRQLGVGVTACGVLSRGLLSGHWSRERSAAPGDLRSRSPRFRGENLARSLALVEALRVVADARGATVAQVAIGWARSRGPDVVPVVGARRRDRLAAT